MFERVLVDQNPQWKGDSPGAGIPRRKLKEIIPYIGKKQVVVITGIRRCGKSFVLKQIMGELRETGVDPERLLFLNVEHPYFDEFRKQVKYLEIAFEEYLSLAEVKDKPFVFLDEVQFFEHWQVFVKSHYEKEDSKFFLTGSNAWLLSSEFVSLLSGRVVHFELFPFDFKEFLSAKKLALRSKIDVAAQSGRIRKYFREYLLWGGFPEIVLTETEGQKKELLINYYRNIIYRDIMPRFNIANTRETEELAHYLLTHCGKPLSYAQLSKTLGLSDKTIKEYINYFSQAYLLYELNRYSPSLKKQLANLKRIYCADLGFVSAIAFQFSENLGRYLENLVFIELKRRGKEVYYHKEKRECDFVIKEGRRITAAIQVCHELNEETREREVEGLIDALATHKLKEGLILTSDQENLIKEQGYVIQVMPLWRWLL